MKRGRVQRGIDKMEKLTKREQDVGASVASLMMLDSVTVGYLSDNECVVYMVGDEIMTAAAIGRAVIDIVRGVA